MTQDTPVVAIVGAGFSGLTLAWALNRIGVRVEIFEKTGSAGGLLHTEHQPILAESAANAMLANEDVELLFDELQLTPVKAGYRSNKRWIFRDKPRQLPLSLLEIFKTAVNFVSRYLKNQTLPLAGETLQAWGERVLSDTSSNYLVSPAMRGVYAVTADQLSASLVLAPLFKAKSRSIRKRKLKGSLSFKGGLQELTEALIENLQTADVLVHHESVASFTSIKKSFAAAVVATDSTAAGQLLMTENTELGTELKNLPRVDLSSVNIAFLEAKSLKGFGCLFPAGQNFKSMGVLFNSDIFENRSYFIQAKDGPKKTDVENETWITADVSSSDESLLEKILSDRQRLTGLSQQPLWARINRWPRGLPLYGLELEKWLSKRNQINSVENGCRLTELPFPTYLTGNYLGVIGLARILSYNLRLADRIKKEIYAVSDT
jgi:protoporphyrinogen/coproporphyrinogen III oxidase